MIPVIFEHQGTLDKLMGDAIMAFFGAPGELKNHPERAAEAALTMIGRLEALKRESGEKGIQRLRLGIGLNTGQVTVGNLGSPSFMDYTVVGDTVNLGSRLEGLNKTYGTLIIMSASTAERLNDRFVQRELDLVRVKGKEEPVKIFELVGFRNEVDGKKMEMIERFRKGLHQYRRREWEAAQETLSRLLRDMPNDGPTRLYLERLRELTLNPPSSQWTPVSTFMTK
jgi:adenylate cyclase